MYSICDCRYTTRPPFCDGIHYDLPLRYLKKIKDCPKAPHDPAVTKLCEECGWAGPRESWPELPSTDSDESSLSDSDLDEEDLAKKKQLHEEASLKREAANKPKVQVQVQSTAQTQDNGTGDLDSRMEIDDEVQEGVAYKIGCSGACQTDPSEISKIAAEIQRVNLSS
ncbi:hypothetical protein BGW38_005240 [Lunasporangiospora selenospora]|uniref:Iron-binding zinc finger CDGSH type n=1 Tax=Lunasporangiospora selenospora TaxID=979761 RepID=A0A9P6FP41_9FUNG|nr:hypothetical protein BGW38_005240 [Lunasporangiospora selenospora]